MPDITAALALLRRPIEAAGTLAVGPVKEAIARARASYNLKSIYTKLNSTQKVKTIWNVDRPISINSFYYPAKVRANSGVTQTLVSLDDLPANAVILTGTVGQGKSILLRFLLGKEFKSGERLPFFIELRRTPTDKLEKYVRDTFDDLLSTRGHPGVFDHFAKSGRLSLLFDGFDEVDPEFLNAITTCIERFASLYPTSRIIVTSRPGSAIENSPLFEVVSVSPMEESDLLPFFTKILPLRDRDIAGRITKALANSPHHVKALASTPLLATMLTILYRANQKIPTDFAEFYDDLFQILLVRHDRSKAGWERKRKTKLGDREIQQVFEAFAYKSKRDGTSSLSKPKAIDLARASIRAQSVDCDETNFISDICQVTCLLQEEGGRIEFLHQSVQEYYASRYVQSRPDEIAQRFYSALMKDGKWKAWDQELRFLLQTDSFRSRKYFFVPALRQLVDGLESLEKVASADLLKSLITDKVGIRQSIARKTGSTEQTRYLVHELSASTVFGMAEVHATVFRLFFGPSGIVSGKWLRLFDKQTNDQYISYSDIAKGCEVTPRLDAALQTAVLKIKTELRDHMSILKNLTSSDDFMDI